MRWLIIRILLAFFIFNTTAWLLGRAFYAASYLLARNGAPELWEVLHQYPFGKSIAIGLLAGLVPFELWLIASGFIRREILDFLAKLELDRMKPWLVVMYSPVLFMAIADWVMDWNAMHSRTISVLGDSPTMPIWKIYEGFFSTTCQNLNLGDHRLDLWNENFTYQCTVHVLTLSTFIMAAGYSIAPFLKSRLPDKEWAKPQEIDFEAKVEAELGNPATPDKQAE
ncbi:MAG TPA: hypothetical protein VK716_02160 [Terracidiphilus sp.]|nr:hypothetical protein [Terracidiphilus sp.]